MEYLRQLLSGIADVWRKLSTSARVNIVVAGLGVAALIAAIVWMGAQPQYVTLSSQLSPQDATKIADELAQAGVPYKFTNNNATVMVPANRRSDMQLLLAQSNLPVG